MENERLLEQVHGNPILEKVVSRVLAMSEEEAKLAWEMICECEAGKPLEQVLAAHGL